MVFKFTVAKFRLLSCLINCTALFLLFPQMAFSQNGWNLQYSSGGELRDIDFLNPNTGFSVGWYGRIVKTTNAGVNWNELPVFTSSNDFHCLKILDNNNIVVGSINKIYKSGDFGLHWDSSNFNVYFSDVAYNNSRILICGDNKLLSSTDLGNNWNIQTFTPLFGINTMNLNGICFADANTCWLVSSEESGFPLNNHGGRVFCSTNQGLSWFVSLTIYNRQDVFENVFFINSLTGFISGWASFFLTSNSGSNWNDLSSDLNMDAHRTFFINSETGYLIGSNFNPPAGNAEIRFTTNHGIDWSTQLNIGGNIYTSTFYGIHFINNSTGWVCGYHDGVGSVIYKTTNGGISGISNENKVPVSFSLSQNYPNPFNSSTFITYTLPVASKVTLRIYDISGRLLSVPVSTNQPAGEYKINLDANNFASGVYFYRLETGNYINVKKMVLVK